RNTDPDVHPERILSVTDALRRISDIKAMVKLLDSEDKLKILAANVLAKTGKAQGARAICERIFSSQGHVKRAMTDALAAIGGASLRETFHALLNDPDGHVISSSLYALGRNGDTDDISVMEPFLNHKYPDVREVAIQSIVLIGTVHAEDVFMLMTKDVDPSKRIVGLN